MYYKKMDNIYFYTKLKVPYLKWSIENVNGKPCFFFKTKTLFIKHPLDLWGKMFALSDTYLYYYRRMVLLVSIDLT